MTATTAPRLVTALSTVPRLLLVAAVLLGALFTGAAPASAHAALTGSDPKDGAVVATAPKGVTLTFSEQIALGDDAIRVLEPSGARADTGELRDLCAGSVVKYGVALRAGLPDGTYTVAWRAVSADSHPIAGAFTFSIGAPSKTTVALPRQEAGGGAVGVLYGIARYVSYAGFILLVGGAAFVLACWPRGAAVRPVQRLVSRGWVALTAATLALLLLRGPYTGLDFGLGSLGAVLETKTGAALVSRLLLLGAAALFVAVLFGAWTRREEAEKKDLTFGLALGGSVIAAGIAGTWALSEHASAGLQPGIAMPVDVLHLLAMAAWLGGLAALLVALHREPSIERTAVRRFSRVAFGSVAVLAATGIYQSWRQVGSWSALTGTAYGRLLLIKVALVAVLVAVAWISRRWTRGLAETAPAVAAPAVATEAAVAAPAEAKVEGPAVAGKPTEEAEPAATTPADAKAEAPAGAEKPTGAGKPADTEEPAEAGNPADADEPAEAGKPTEEAEPAATTPTDAKAEAPADAAKPTGAGKPAEAEDPPAESEEPAEVGKPADAQGPADAGEPVAGPDEVPQERAAQLARQQAALAAARRKRARDADPGRAGLRRSVLAEAGVAVVLLAVTTVLTTTEPGRTEQEAARAQSAPSTAVPDRPVDLTLPFDTGGRGGKGTVRLTLAPGRSGTNALHVFVDGANGRRLDVPELKVSFTLEAQRIGPLPITPDRVATGHYSSERLQIPMPGEWTIRITVRTSDFDQTTIDKNVKIG
ncbi:copper resistance protein CopC [Streptomyces sp. NRRL S-118]|uniref:copper resistance protein CopC n=1 Tax=Streptomyces sp. NRRL S-118 TaxID=1463881 RepID=UPI0004CC1A77|nr:copper resistance protein CopC [Streptomyces sp. NRRL S-118]